MNPRALLFLLLVTACGGVPLRVHAPVTLPASLGTRGDSIYFGSTFPLKGEEKAPLFVYERRVEALDGALTSTHITRTPEGVVAVAEQATHTTSYELLDYTLLTDQQGQTGRIRVEGDRVTLSQGEGSRVETGPGAVVVGPTLVGYIFKRLDSLRSGKTLPVRFAVLERLETLGFELASVPAHDGQTRVRMTPASFVIRLVVDPVFFTFETASGKLVRIEGRVPPKRVSAGKLFDLDARVEYRFVADAYR
jgi:hypothetical protein